MTQPTAQFSVAGKRVTLMVAERIHHFHYSAGFRYLIPLLQNPGKSFSARYLVHGEHEVAAEYKALSQSTEMQRQRNHLYSFDYLPPLAKADWRTVREVSARLNFLIEKEAVLREGNDLSALDELLDEKEHLISYLSDVMRKNGKLKNYLDADRKAAATVNKALRRAIQQIIDCEPELGRELKRGVHAWYEVYFQPSFLVVSC